MKTKQTILDQYTKYLETIKSCNKEEIPYNFKKFNEFLTKNADGEFRRELQLVCVKATVDETKKRQLRFKDVANNWSGRAVKDCYECVKKLDDIWKEELKKIVPNVPNEFKVLTSKLFKLIEDQDDPSLQLYMYMMHMESSNGEKLYESSDLKTLYAKASEEEAIKA